MAVSNAFPGKSVVVVDGTRTPFLRSGTGYARLMSYQLGAFAIAGLLKKTGMDAKMTDRVIMGTVVHNIVTSNVAREAALTGGVPYTTPAHTVSQACISANQAIAQGADLIRLGQADVVIAGGTECVSDIPIGFPAKMRRKLFASQKNKTFGQNLQFLLSLRPSDFIPEVPRIAEYSTNRTMGQDCDLMAARFGVTREEQDEFAARSHKLAVKAAEEGILGEEITPTEFPPSFKPIKEDNTYRTDATVERLAKLAPAFDKRNGTLTAGNSSFLTDGAAVVLLMSEDKAKDLGYDTSIRIRNYVFTGQDPNEELLLGPAYATYRLLQMERLTLKDLDVVEFHEAFAAQIVTNLKALNSDEFAMTRIGLKEKAGEINMDQFNIHGGSLSLGHPFGATGARLVTTAMNRLKRENGRLALLAACAAGAHGHGMILEQTSK